jgi:hypothetical protein
MGVEQEHKNNWRMPQMTILRSKPLSVIITRAQQVLGNKLPSYP